MPARFLALLPVVRLPFRDAPFSRDESTQIDGIHGFENSGALARAAFDRGRAAFGLAIRIGGQ